jgi:5-methylcytosine-specific restriction protein A
VAVEWSNDELILALDVYVRERRQNKTSPHVRELEELFRALPREPGADLTPRSADAIAMMHSNFASLDPEFSSKGLPGIGARAAQIYAAYATRPKELRAEAQAIRMALADGAITDVEHDEAEWTAMEGESLIRIHRVRERNSALAKRRKSEQVAKLGHLQCEICRVSDADLAARYQLEDGDVFECHHRLPLSELSGKKRTRTADLAVLCPTCHRALHRRIPLPSVETMQSGFGADDGYG